MKTDEVTAMRYAGSGMCHIMRSGSTDASVEECQAMNMLVDRMFGLDESDDSKADHVLRRAARLVCESCPVRMECLADATVSMENTGIYGGLGVEERKSVARMAEAKGLAVRDVSVARQRGGRSHAVAGHDGRYSSVQAKDEARRRRDYTAWLKAHPDAIADARLRDSSSRAARRNRSNTGRGSEQIESESSALVEQMLF
ncbi:MAG: WhiB family transcriptional regulator [Bifidobacterium sp.]|nr:WhiB family transcriptional regulator [Bifidobacterium sp.]MCI1865030.1 WhiB family transcriptional regulator [Bifidobacterium sp.]